MTMNGDGDTPAIWTPRGVRSGIEAAEKADDLRALSSSVIATPPRSQADRPASPSFVMWLGAQADGFSQWGVAPKLRDAQLREFFPKEALLAGAMATVSARNAALSWKVTGHEATADAAQGLLNNANNGMGWEDFISKLSLDLYSTDTGAFVELVRTGNGPDYPVFGINNLDSTRCYPTGVPEFPVLYEDTNGRMHRMPWYTVVQLLEMPSAKTPTFAGAFYRLQYCAVTRVLRYAQIAQSIATYTDEKIGGRFMRAVHLISGVDESHVRDMLATANNAADQQGLTRYMTPAIVGSVDPAAQVKHEVVELATLPDAFNSKEEREGYILALALCFLTDYGEFAPLPGGGLGTASQSQTMNEKSRGKGPGLFQKLILRLINQHGVLPTNVEFEWDEADLEADAKEQEIRSTRATTRQTRIASGELDTQAAREIALEDGDLTQQQFDALVAREQASKAAAAARPAVIPGAGAPVAIQGEQKGPQADAGRNAAPADGTAPQYGLRSIEGADEGERLSHDDFIAEDEWMGTETIEQARERAAARDARGEKFNPNHEPSGSPTGGQFAPVEGGGGAGGRWRQVQPGEVSVAPEIPIFSQVVHGPIQHDEYGERVFFSGEREKGPQKFGMDAAMLTSGTPPNPVVSGYYERGSGFATADAAIAHAREYNGETRLTVSRVFDSQQHAEQALKDHFPKYVRAEVRSVGSHTHRHGGLDSAPPGHWINDWAIVMSLRRLSGITGGTNELGEKRVRGFFVGAEAIISGGHKAADTLVAAGLAVVAEDTGRVLMIQRALTDGDPAAGTWEFPGGHIDDETPLEAAQREWAEETAMTLPDGEVVGEWDSPNGVYRGFVYRVPSEFAVHERDGNVINPDDPDGDQVESIAWWDAAHLRQNSAIRQELADNLAPMYEALAMGSKAWSATEVTQERLDYEDSVTAQLTTGLATAVTAIRARLQAGQKFNPNHEPGGSPVGGQFAGGNGGSGTDTAHERRSSVELRTNAIEHGGATYNVITGSELRVGTGTDGPYVVAEYPERGESISLDEYKSTGLAAQSAYVALNKDVLTGPDDRAMHFGIWVDGARVVFDVVRVVSNRDEAIRLGVARNQEAIFDAGHGVEIPTGGTGGAESAKKAEGPRMVALVPMADLIDNPEAQRALYEQVVASL